MRKFLALGVLMALLTGTASAALFESKTNDAQPMVLYGKTTTGAIAPLLVGPDGSLSTVYSPAVWVDCVATAGSSGELCSGSVTTTTGSITTGTNSLVVASTTGWSVGMGIAVANAGTGGTTELITYITAINGSTFTLNDNAAATATNQTVYHDDTRAIQAALDSDKNVHLRAGNYNITSTLTLSVVKMVIGDGFVGRGSNSSGLALTNLIYRKTTGNGLTISVGYVQVKDFSYQVDSAVTHTSGFAIEITTSGSSADRWHNLKSLLLYNWNGGIKLSTTVSFAEINNVVIGIRDGSTSDGVYYDNPSTAGDNRFVNVDIRPVLGGSYTGAGVHIVNADVSSWTGIKTIGGTYGMLIDTGTVKFQRIINSSFENNTGANPLIYLNGNNIDYISIIGCEIGTNASGYGVSISSGAGGVTIVGNMFSTLSRGVDVSSGATDFQVYSNSFSSVGDEVYGLSNIPLNVTKSSTLATSSLALINSAASGSGSGAILGTYQDDSTVPISGDRLGGYVAGGPKDTAHTLAAGGGLMFFANGTWSSTSLPTNLEIQLAPSGSTSRTAVGKFDSTGSFFLNNASAHAGQATCWTTSGKIGYCTDAQTAGGACTCTGL